MSHPEDYLFYSFKPLNQIGEIESIHEISKLFENETNLMNYQYCKKVIDTSASAGIKGVFNHLTMDLSGKYSVTNEMINSTEFKERVLKRIEEKLKVTHKVNHADNDYGYLQKCVALKFHNTSIILILSEELIQLSTSQKYIDSLVKLFKYDHSVVSLACRIGTSLPSNYSNYLTLEVDQTLDLIDYPKLVTEIRQYLRNKMSIHHDSHAGGWCVSYTNQYQPVIRGAIAILDKYTKN